MKKQPAINKGFVMEELLRNYFLRAGYYAVRGVPFVYQEFDVTDIDIWLYGRMSAVSREITIVDAKNKKTPQAIERIFWVFRSWMVHSFRDLISPARSIQID